MMIMTLREAPMPMPTFAPVGMVEAEREIGACEENGVTAESVD